jgi:hypothetical protein
MMMMMMMIKIIVIITKKVLGSVRLSLLPINLKEQ